MAGDWIKMRVDLIEDPAVIEISSDLNVDEYAVVGRLHKLWSWADRHCITGHAKSVTFVWINKYVDLPGFAECMLKVGWLEKKGSGIEFPKFDRHNGKSAKTRAEATERKRKERENEAKEVSQDLCDKSVTREEKRREELTTTLTNPNGLVVASVADDDLARQSHPAIEQAMADTANNGAAVTSHSEMGNGGHDQKQKHPNCPHQEIVALYHEMLPMCPRIRDWAGERAVQLRARWNEDKSRQNLDYWRKLFEYVGKCDFLVGRASGKNGKPFFADLEFITKYKYFTRIREGKYE